MSLPSDGNPATAGRERSPLKVEMAAVPHREHLEHIAEVACETRPLVQEKGGEGGEWRVGEKRRMGTRRSEWKREGPRRGEVPALRGPFA